MQDCGELWTGVAEVPQVPEDSGTSCKFIKSQLRKCSVSEKYELNEVEMEVYRRSWWG